MTAIPLRPVVALCLALGLAIVTAGPARAEAGGDDADALLLEFVDAQMKLLPAITDHQAGGPAFEAFRALAAKGYAPAMFELGHCYEEGYGVAKDAAAALHWQVLAAKGGDAQAQFVLGEHYLNGMGVPASPARALQWLQAAAAQLGSSSDRGQMYGKSAVMALVEIYGEGEGGVAKDPAVSLHWLRLGAAGGADEARIQLAERLDKGDGVPRDPKAALALLRAAAENDSEAQTALADMIARGDGTPADPAAAAALYRKGAEMEWGKAMVRLGQCYEHGLGVKKDFGEAAKWYLKAAKSGEDEAMCLLGGLYLRGDGVPVDLVEAYAWTLRAGGEDDEATAGQLAAIAKRMTPAQIERGKQREAEMEAQVERDFDKAMKDFGEALKDLGRSDDAR